MAACNNNNKLNLGDTSNLDLVKSGVLTVGISPGFAPFESYIDGSIQGIDVELAEMIAKDLNLSVDFKSMKYESLLSAINNKEIDVAISAINVTSDKKKFVAFTSPYYSDEKIFVAKSSSSINDKNIDQTLQEPNIKVACIKTSSAEDLLKSNYNNVARITFTTNKDIISSLNNDECGLALIYKSVLDVYKDANLKNVKSVGDNDECAIAIDKANTDLLKIINKDLSIRNSDGTISEIINRWLYSKE